MASKPWEIDRQRFGGVRPSPGGRVADRPGRRVGIDYMGTGVQQNLNDSYLRVEQRVDRALQKEDEGNGNMFGPKGSFSGRTQTPPPPPPGPAGPGGYGGGGYGYGGGGGGGGAALELQFGPYAEQVKKILQSQMKVGPSAWQGQIDPALDKDIASAREAFAGVPEFDANAFADLNFQPTPQMDPQAAALIEAQGGDPALYTAQVDGAQAGLDQMAALWENYRTGREADVASLQDMYAADLGAQEAQAVSGLEAQRSALQVAASREQQMREEERKSQVMEALIALLGQGYQAGEDVSSLDLGGFF